MPTLIISLAIVPSVSPSATLKESAGMRVATMGGAMMTQVITYRSLTAFYAASALGMGLSLVIGFYLAMLFQLTAQLDWLFFLGVFLGLPVAIASISFYMGWRQKKDIVGYNAPDWELKPVQMTIEDARSLPHEYNRKYSRLVANSNFWLFFTPTLLIILIMALPLYSIYEDDGLSGFIPVLNALLLVVLFSVTLLGAFRATSNSASADFTLPLIREAVRLADLQGKVAGVCQVQVVIDKGKDGELEIYDNPRVVIRVKGLEDDAYVESWSDDLKAVTKVLCRLFEKDGKPQVVWWWISTDRNFRKFIYPDEEGYYVKNPVRTNVSNPGVQDVVLVTENAIALIVKEYLQTRAESAGLHSLLEQLNVENH